MIILEAEKLYYDDPYIHTFQANIFEKATDENGIYLVLDKTAFYPTGGGQPHDIGTLNDIAVVNVEEVNGEIRHYIEAPIDATEVTGIVNWARRFDHMQQHAGQHILSAAFDSLYGYKTVSFHLGTETCTIDLDVTSLTKKEVSNVEDKANEIILENRPIETKWVTEDELEQYSLRKDLSVTENIRLVIIPEFDYNGCGGTHPSSTAEVAAISILHWEKEKNKVRVYFVCGNRVRNQLSEKHYVIQRLNDVLSAPQNMLESAAIRIIEDQKQLEKTIVQLKNELLQFEAEKLYKHALELNNYELVHHIFSDKEMRELQQLAKNITQAEDKSIVLLVSDYGEKLQFVCARGKNVEVSMKEHVGQILPLINGRGGGNDLIAQGGGDLLLSAEDLMEKMKETLIIMKK